MKQPFVILPSWLWKILKKYFLLVFVFVLCHHQSWYLLILRLVNGVQLARLLRLAHFLVWSSMDITQTKHLLGSNVLFHFVQVCYANHGNTFCSVFCNTGNQIVLIQFALFCGNPSNQTHFVLLLSCFILLFNSQLGYLSYLHFAWLYTDGHLRDLENPHCSNLVGCTLWTRGCCAREQALSEPAEKQVFAGDWITIIQFRSAEKVNKLN